MSRNAWLLLALVGLGLGLVAWWTMGKGKEQRDLADDDEPERQLDAETTDAPRVDITGASGTGGVEVTLRTVGLAEVPG